MKGWPIEYLYAIAAKVGLGVDLAARGVVADRVDVRAGSEPIAPHDRIRAVRARADDVRGTHRVQIRVAEDVTERNEMRRELERTRKAAEKEAPGGI